ncbi:adenosylcobinamide-GDP ribazoletransferase [Dyadobacter crusticola]|uniref:adenosylcobinamide-GDP ribazoletransferase n=1 Tax=Dyadobacter crusticola TaxID=292407 RepID=UPI0004E1C3CA|nr:adenosylcobinamide-GDP ribazoletransferase [Dyadobacter crusticola]
MRHQAALFFAALQFYTRIPIPGWVVFKPENLSPATRFLPLIGWIVGGISAAVWLVISPLTGFSIAIVFSIIASILTTGALHEDGFADTCDGFGGGWTRDKILVIMKDSRLGTYGALGLIGILALKFALLQELADRFDNQVSQVFGLMIAAHAISRLMPASIIYNQPYARDTDDSKAKPVAQNVTAVTLAIAAMFGIVPLLLLCTMFSSALPLLSIPFLGVVTWAMSRYFVKWIGGYTGDCLGAVQQVCEVGFYFCLIAIWKFI